MKEKIGSREGAEKLRFWLKFLLVCGAASLLADIFVACTEVTQTVGPTTVETAGQSPETAPEPAATIVPPGVSQWNDHP